MSNRRFTLNPLTAARNAALMTTALFRKRPVKTIRALLRTAPVALLTFALIVSLSPTLSSEVLAPTATRSITFPNAGKYLVSLPETITSPVITTSEQLRNALQAAVGCNSVSRHDALTDTFLRLDSAGICSRCNPDFTSCTPEPGGIGCGCFCVDTTEGRGYLVDVGAGTFSMTANDGPMIIDLEAPGPPSLSGTNFISLPYDTPLATAKDLFQEIGPSNVQVVQRFITSSEQYQAYTYGLPDFPLKCSEGYVVKMGTTLSYVPSHSGVVPPQCQLGGPIPCDQSPLPVCDGECPTDQVCDVDATGMVCACEPIGSPCEQCGPGPHFIDACGPFPPVGTDLVANNGAVVGIDLDFDCVRDVNAVLRPCPTPNQLLHIEKTLGPIDDSANFPGTSPVDGHPTGPGLDVIDTEIIAMCLTNGAITMAAGTAGPSALPLQPSLGTVAEDLATPDSTMADSKFDVYFEVAGVPGGPLYNQVPLEVTSTIDCLPPKANYHHPVGICVPLTTSGTCVGGVNGGNVCINNLDCPGGTCDGLLVMANLVSANHSVNQHVCSEELFPECDGDCPPDEICVQSPIGCECERIQPPPCEAGPFPECAGDCPPGTHCEPDDFTQECICVDDVFCEQGPFPVCDGPCPPDTHCEPNGVTQTCDCVDDVVPCEQSDPAVCDGDCPIPGDVCNIDSLGGPCYCGPPIPVPCVDSAFPTCDGECPIDQVCDVVAGGTACACEPIGSPCEQCGPGPHFIDACGPFPPVGTDLVANNGAVVGIDMDFDCVRDVNAVLRPCPTPNQLLHIEKTLGPIDDSANFPGTSPVDGHPTGPGLDVIDTEIIAMCLTNGAITMAAGVGGPSALPLQPSLGTVAEDLATPDSTMADSKFNVFFEVAGVPGGPLYNQVPLEVTSTIDCLPPKANYHHPVGICVPLTTSGICVGGVNGGNVCVSNLDCPGGTCDGTMVIANLVSANHSVNQPVCSEDLFPECDGDCPPDEICVQSPIGCECERIQPPPCEAGPFPECAGGCPPGTHCEPDDFTQECICIDDVVLCEQQPFPVCDGPCPPDTHCEPNDVTQGCECVDDVVPCEQSDPAVCDGDCLMAGDVCHIDPLGGPCYCGPPIPVPCVDSAFPTCDGECPIDQVCDVVAGGTACACEPIGSPCEQCGPGPHFIDNCGPFPPVGTDLVANNGAVVGIDLDFDCVRDVNAVLRPCPTPNQLLHIEKTLGPIDDSVNFPGTSPVDGHPTGPGLDVIDTEIIAMCLTNGAITMAAGIGGPSALPLQPTLGTVAEDLASPDPTQADSKFDVYFEVAGVPGGPLYNQAPLEVTSTIGCLPPQANYHHPVGICVPLTTSGICVGGVNGGNACVNDLDCPGGTCDGTMVMANLVSANHSVNQPVCSEDLFPECDGDCPPNEICVQGPNGCDCEPIQFPPCEQSPFPQCDGECPPDTYCFAQPATDHCECRPLDPPQCSDTVFPVCDGSCPPGTRCAEGGTGAGCDCLPCDVIEPGPVKGVFWLNKVQMFWDLEACSGVYNAYRHIGRFADLNGDGLADRYGNCFQPDLPGPPMVEPGIPVSGEIRYYLVTGENALGEGTMGFASSGGKRPNTTPCP